MHNVIAAVVFVVVGTIVLETALYSYIMVFHYKSSKTFHPLVFKQAYCKEGRQIQGCRHPRGVPSTWEHSDDMTHFCRDGSMVEHI